MDEPTMQTTIAIGVLALLLCLRRRRTGERPPEGGTTNEEARARDEAFLQFNNYNDFP